MNKHEELEENSLHDVAATREWDKNVKVEVGDGSLEFRTIWLDDLFPTAQQLVKKAGLGPVEDFLVFLVAPDRSLIEIGLDKTVDITKNLEPRFLIFRTARTWRVLIDDGWFLWGEATISGKAVKWLADVVPETHAVWLQQQGQPDKLIGDNQLVNLIDSRLERFLISARYCVWIEDKSHPWPQETINTEEIAQLGGWDISQGVVEVDEEQNERTLKAGEVVKLRPGVSYGKKLRFKRG